MKIKYVFILFFLLSLNQLAFAGNFHQNIQERKTGFPEKMINNSSSITLRPDSSYHWYWDSLSGAWQLSSRRLPQTDVWGHVITSINQSWNGTSWENNYFDSSGFDSNFNFTYGLFRMWNGSMWENSNQFFSNYNSNNQYIYDLSQDWDGSTWINTNQYYYWWNVNNNIDSMLGQDWDGAAWINSSFEIDNYDTNQRLISSIGLEWDSINWVNRGQSFYSYNIDGNIEEILNQMWDGSNWNNYGKTNIIYDNNLYPIYYIDSIWDGSVWTFSFSQHQYYDANNVASSIVNTSPFSIDSSHSYYTNITGVEEPWLSDYEISIYPNPSNDYVSIQLPLQLKGKFTLAILELAGRVISSKELMLNPGIAIQSLNISNLISGIYFVKISDGEKTMIGKLIKE